jgi:hypothetical protein
MSLMAAESTPLNSMRGKLAPGNRDGPNHVPDDHAVAVSIEAPPEAPHRNHDRHCSQEQKE